MFRTKVVEKTKPHFMLQYILPEKRLLLDNVGKYCKARQATDDNMAHAQCTLDT
jgi:hypothetical protein